MNIVDKRENAQVELQTLELTQVFEWNGGIYMVIGRDHTDIPNSGIPVVVLKSSGHWRGKIEHLGRECEVTPVECDLIIK